MTNEEAIKILSVEKELHTLQLTTSNDNHYEKIQALDMAISALTEKADLISRTDLLNKIWQKEYGKDYDGVNLLKIPHIDIIEQMPSAEKTAEWNYERFGYRTCSNCGYSNVGTDDDGVFIPNNYCPNCGAKMKGEEEE